MIERDHDTLVTTFCVTILLAMGLGAAAGVAISRLAMAPLDAPPATELPADAPAKRVGGEANTRR